MLIRFSSHSRQATALTFSYGYFIAVLVKLYRSETAILHVNFQEGLNGVYWQMVKTYNWQPTNTRKINRQLIFVVRFAGNLQKALAIVIRLKLIENNFFQLKYYYFNLFSLIFMLFRLFLDRNHHTEFSIKAFNINHKQFDPRQEVSCPRTICYIILNWRPRASGHGKNRNVCLASIVSVPIQHLNVIEPGYLSIYNVKTRNWSNNGNK